jgi:hypothetical protein
MYRPDFSSEDLRAIESSLGIGDNTVLLAQNMEEQFFSEIPGMADIVTGTEEFVNESIPRAAGAAALAVIEFTNDVLDGVGALPPGGPVTGLPHADAVLSGMSLLRDTAAKLHEMYQDSARPD